MEEKKTMRSSNMELLRIVAALMIIAYHIFQFVINPQLTDLKSIEKLNNGFYCYPEFQWDLCICAILHTLGRIANDIFIIISGYFMIDNENINLNKISKKLLLQTSFAISILAFASIYASLDTTLFIPTMINFKQVNDSWWYIGYYYVIIIFAKFFLNKFLNGLSEKNYMMFLLTLFALFSFSWSRARITWFFSEGHIICLGIFLYSFGAYIKKYNPFANLRLWIPFFVIFIMNAVVILNFYIITTSNILTFDVGAGKKFIQYIPHYSDYEFITVINAIALFEIFRRIRIKNSPIINFMGASTLMTFMIGTNGFVIKIWEVYDFVSVLYDSVPFFILILMLWVLGTFMVTVLCYALYVVLENIFKIIFSFRKIFFKS